MFLLLTEVASKLFFGRADAASYCDSFLNAWEKIPSVRGCEVSKHGNIEVSPLVK
jgi:hypothetical protein